jgi:cytochrome c553
MSASYSIPDRVELLRSRTQRYKQLAEALSDHRTAAEVAAYAKELEAEVGRLEKWEESHRGQDRGRTTLAP